MLAVDEPILKGRVFVFHRYPDGVFLSVAAEDVFGVATTTVADEKRLPTDEPIFLGPTGEGASEEPDMLLPYPISTYAYYLYAGCCGSRRPPPPRPLPPPLVGPNGFPIAPGTKPPEIGPNGFPILAPRSR
jgi:hypothetical protein